MPAVSQCVRSCRGRRYLGALAGWGYPLSEIEAAIVATEAAD